ncbi:M1 family metallopeptidase [Micromonospora rifamycinica]|uniref:Aminopeptidase N n=1 Tax=Micromonospora rifamycinica TaxID=291594 RepID=A0A109IJD3_9ACTN|nr:M1 family metallopeptidase [Micromonospora rifamycinica]KWV31632.1 peptidase M1 [Micromonospora rifamycinica]SCG79188.1 Peptidase family M1 [Micromonospora rifamycinica]
MSRHRRGLALLVAVSLALAGCTADRRPGAGSRSTPTSSPSPTPGPAGVGDPYFPTAGNSGYDVDRYTLRVRYDPATDELRGTTTVRATATAELPLFHLDLAGLTVRRVTVDGTPARHAREGAELVVTPAAPVRAGAVFTVEVGYDGRPVPLRNETIGEGGWLHTADGAVALGQPESASTWFPVNDHPSDKATYDVEITVPQGLVAVANGVPQGQRPAAGGWTTWRWSEATPMASYLSTVVIGKYRTTTGEHRGRPVFSAVASSLPRGAADASVARTLEVADHLESIFGRYPFGAYGGVVVDEPRIRYALETQSRPVYSANFFRAGENTGVVAHELAHQWFGDSITVARWEDIWLNEGLATYAEWLWAEHQGGDTTQAAFDQEYVSSDDQLWRVPPGAPGVANLFSSSVYQRGAMTVHALRVTVGDDAFFRILRTWVAEKRNGNATTAEFVATAERVSGQQLDDLFAAWLYGTERPPTPTRAG